MFTLLPVAKAALRAVRLSWNAGGGQARAFEIGAVAVAAALFATFATAAQRILQIRTLNVRVAQLDIARATTQAQRVERMAPDFPIALPSAPEVADVMRTLQLVSANEHAIVTSLQADKHPATPTALGHLDLVVAIKAPYPIMTMMLREVLDRYPGATIHQLSIRGPSSEASPASPTPAFVVDGHDASAYSEARVTFNFWDRVVAKP